MRLGVDAMGGDYAPEAAVLGAIEACSAVSKDTTIVLFGNERQIREIIQRENCVLPNIEIVHTTEVIAMNDNPTSSFSAKSDSSIVVGFTYLKAGKIDGFASAGSTGAMMVGCMHVVKQVDGIIRPTIASTIPTVKGGKALLLDVGINIDCKPEVLYQYGIIGSIYSREVLKKDNPRIGLLNIGEEQKKGNNQTKAAYELMAEGSDFNFVGNVEAKHIFSGDVADVFVCDGFVGNTILKEAEGMYAAFKSLGVKGIDFLDALNYENEGGTPVLGVNNCVIIGHGCSTPKAIKNMILQTEKTIKAGLVEKIKETFCE